MTIRKNIKLDEDIAKVKGWKKLRYAQTAASPFPQLYGVPPDAKKSSTGFLMEEEVPKFSEEK